MTTFSSVKKSCQVCSKVFYVQPCRIKNGRGKSCSSKCYFISKKGKSSWNKGKNNWWVTGDKSPRWKGGKPKCIDCSTEISYGAKYCKKHVHKEERSSVWKGQEVGYVGLHLWVSKKLGKPRYCEFCKKTDLPHRSYNWANKSKKYKREVSDWIRLCVPCHRIYDRK